MKGHASPYATGGGGTVLEHAYGGALLARLLQQGPVRGLGDDVTPIEVRFQQAASVPVDDLVVVGQCATGERALFVGVRRNPTIGASSPAFVSLLVDYLRMVVDHRAAHRIGGGGDARVDRSAPAEQCAVPRRRGRAAGDDGKDS
ncbi:hypothetical protein HRW14_26895 [Streptomyces lunaelactis]|nr:hypothetical protein [Streptomyces lunaelactis]